MRLSLLVVGTEKQKQASSESPPNDVSDVSCPPTAARKLGARQDVSCFRGAQGRPTGHSRGELLLPQRQDNFKNTCLLIKWSLSIRYKSKYCEQAQQPSSYQLFSNGDGGVSRNPASWWVAERSGLWGVTRSSLMWGGRAFVITENKRQQSRTRGDRKPGHRKFAEGEWKCSAAAVTKAHHRGTLS